MRAPREDDDILYIQQTEFDIQDWFGFDGDVFFVCVSKLKKRMNNLNGYNLRRDPERSREIMGTENEFPHVLTASSGP